MSPAPSASTLLPSGDKLEMELESAPKGLILTVKEPGESNLIVGRASIMRGFPRVGQFCQKLKIQKVNPLTWKPFYPIQHLMGLNFLNF